MSIDSTAFPLPVVIKGYACLTKAEMELASKDIDPARPQNGPGGRDAPRPEPDAPVKRATATPGPELSGQVLSYTPDAVRTVPVKKATRYSSTA